MATDLDVTTAVFGTGNLLIASGDDISGATGYGWGTQVAQNTGAIYYQARQICNLGSNAAGGAEDPTITNTYGNVYLTAGEYSIYTCITTTTTGGAGTAETYFDGTLLTQVYTATTATGSLCGWTASEAGWYIMRLYLRAGPHAGIAGYCGFSLRLGSFAP